MKVVVWLLVCALCAGAQESPPTTSDMENSVSSTTGEIREATTERSARFLNFKNLYTSAFENNEVDPEEKKNKKKKGEEQDGALHGLYSDCMISFSLPCLQKKFLVFLDKLGRMDGFSIFGDFLSVKRTSKETTKPITEKVLEARMNYPNYEEDLSSLVDYTIDRFFKTHRIQIRLPFGMKVADAATEKGRSSDTDGSVLDLAFPRALSEGRGKKKKIFLLLWGLAKAKVSLLLPLALIFLKFKALKALFFAKLALLLALVGLAKALGLGGLAAGSAGLAAGTAGLGGLAAGLGGGKGGGGGGGGYGGGGGGHGGGGGGYGGGGYGGGSGGGGGGNKVVIIHDPHHATGGGGGHHDGGGGGSGSYGYGTSGGGGGGGGGWSSGGDSYSVGGGGGGGWGRSWTPTDAHGHLLSYRKFNSTDKT